MTYFRIIPLILLILAVQIGCSEHCDDEDYTREQTEKKIVQLDTSKTKQLSDNNIIID